MTTSTTTSTEVSVNTSTTAPQGFQPALMGTLLVVFLAIGALYFKKNHRSNQANISAPRVKSRTSLIMVFGIQQLEKLKHLERGTLISSEMMPLFRKVEWFWFGSSTDAINHRPNEIGDDDKNMCWLQIDFEKPDYLEDRISSLEVTELLRSWADGSFNPADIAISQNGFSLISSGLKSKGYVMK